MKFVRRHRWGRNPRVLIFLASTWDWMYTVEIRSGTGLRWISLYVALTDLMNDGWVETKVDPNDGSPRRMYRLVPAVALTENGEPFTGADFEAVFEEAERVHGGRILARRRRNRRVGDASAGA